MFVKLKIAGLKPLETFDMHTFLCGYFIKFMLVYLFIYQKYKLEKLLVENLFS